MNNRSDFTLEEIKEMVDDLAAEANDPQSELYSMLQEMTDASIAAAKFDVNLADRFLAIRQSFVDLVDYVKSRKELH